MVRKITDNQSCLCVVDKIEESLSQIAAEHNKVSEEFTETKLFLNRSSLVNQFKQVEAMVVPEGVTEIVYKIEKKPFIKKLWLPSTIQKMTFIPSGFKRKCVKGFEVFISKDNPNYICSDGIIYSKDFKELVFCYASKVSSINVHCEKIRNYAFLPVHRNYGLLKNIKAIGSYGIFVSGLNVKIPEGIEILDSDFCEFVGKKNLKVSIPASVKNISDFIWGSKVKVSKKNENYVSLKGFLYSKDFKNFYKGHNKSIKIKEGCQKVSFDNCSATKTILPASVTQIDKTEKNFCNIYFEVNGENREFASWKGSLYSKDFSKLLFLYVQKNGDVYIHPDCKTIEKGAIFYPRYRKFKGGNFEVPECFAAEETLKDLRKKIFYRINYSTDGVEKKSAYTAKSVKQEVEGETVRFERRETPMQKEIAFPENLEFVETYYNPGQKEFIPIFVSKENKSLSADHDFVNWGEIQLDCKIADIIISLNEKGLKTSMCCSGHLLTGEYFWTINEAGIHKVRGKVLERRRRSNVVSGYVEFDKVYPEIKKLFKKENCISDKLKKFLGIKEKFEYPVFRYYAWKNKIEKRIGVVFKYRPTEEAQNEAMEILREKLGV